MRVTHSPIGGWRGDHVDATVARRWPCLAPWLAVTLALGPAASRAQSRPSQAHDAQTFRERVDVSRVLVDVRVLDSAGHAIEGLGQADFSVTIDDATAPVESVEWVPDVTPAAVTASTAAGASPPMVTAAPADGQADRWLVILVQRKTARAEMVGLMRLANDAASFAEWFARAGRVAVVSFDSQLHSWTTFTSDGQELRRILTSSLIASAPPLGVRVEANSGSVHTELLPAGSTQPDSLEQAMQRIAEMLQPLPGTKSVVVLGNGMGTWVPRLDRVDLGSAYEQAVASLQRARVSVFSFDYTDADYHPRQEGLMQLAADTGGRFWQANLFTGEPLNQLRRVLAGHYVLVVSPPGERVGWRSLSVKTAKRGTTVLAKSGYGAGPR